MNIDLSVVSHRQGALASLMLQDVSGSPEIATAQLTLNLPEPDTLVPQWPQLRTRLNPQPLGFATNHNQAFASCKQPFFCVANPDLRLPINPFPALLRGMEDPQVGLIAPIVLNPAGALEDSARHFPTPQGLIRKAFGKEDGRYNLEPNLKGAPRPVDWVAGMFLLFRAEAFRDVGGFDANFHLYYEDVDICARMWRAGWKVIVSPQATVVHDAQRASRQNPQYMAWHAASMGRYFFKHFGRLPLVPGQDEAPTPPRN